jgi:hypothetical protein
MVKASTFEASEAEVYASSERIFHDGLVRCNNRRKDSAANVGAQMPIPRQIELKGSNYRQQAGVSQLVRSLKLQLKISDQTRHRRLRESLLGSQKRANG